MSDVEKLAANASGTCLCGLDQLEQGGVVKASEKCGLWQRACICRIACSAVTNLTEGMHITRSFNTLWSDMSLSNAMETFFEPITNYVELS